MNARYLNHHDPFRVLAEVVFVALTNSDEKQAPGEARKGDKAMVESRDLSQEICQLSLDASISSCAARWLMELNGLKC
jgi:hypothetical protein